MSTARFNGLRKPASHVVWFKHYGTWPRTRELDHRNGNHSDNRIENLREATRAENCCNLICPRNTSGERGVVMNREVKRWYVKVKSGRTIVHQPASHKISAIVAARLIRRTLHGEFAIDARHPICPVPAQAAPGQFISAAGGKAGGVPSQRPNAVPQGNHESAALRPAAESISTHPVS